METVKDMVTIFKHVSFSYKNWCEVDLVMLGEIVHRLVVWVDVGGGDVLGSNVPSSQPFRRRWKKRRSFQECYVLTWNGFREVCYDVCLCFCGLMYCAVSS